MYSRSRMDVSSFFNPSTFEAQIKATSESGSNMLGPNTIAQMRRPSLELGVRYQLGDNDSFRDVFARFGDGKILCSNGSGHAPVYDVDAHSVVGRPAMKSHKDWYVAVHVRLAAEHGWSDPEVEGGALVDDKHGDSVHALEYLSTTSRAASRRSRTTAPGRGGGGARSCRRHSSVVPSAGRSTVGLDLVDPPED